jgi:hypothetical protein
MTGEKRYRVEIDGKKPKRCKSVFPVLNPLILYYDIGDPNRNIPDRRLSIESEETKAIHDRCGKEIKSLHSMVMSNSNIDTIKIEAEF